MATRGVNYAGDFELSHAIIMNPDESTFINLVEDTIITEINIFETIFSNSVVGSIIFADTRELISKFPFVGQEKLFIQLRTPSDDLDKPEHIIDHTEIPLMIHKIPIRRGISSGAQVYEMQFISNHAIVNATKRISKSYVNTKSNIGEIVKDLLKMINVPDDKIILETTVGSRPYLVQNSTPLSFIARLTKEAISTQNNSPHYVFFANKDGVHFRTIQNLFDQPPKGIFHGGDVGFDTPDQNDSVSGKVIQNYRRILDYDLIQGNDLLLNAHGGMVGGKVIEHNVYRKRIETKTFDYFSGDFDQHQRIDSERIYNREAIVSSSDEITNSNITLIPISKNKRDFDTSFELGKTANQRFKTILQRQSRFLELHKGTSVRMEVNGYTSLTAGDMVTVNLPTIGGDDDDGNIVTMYSGDYLIKGIRHKFATPLSASRIHTMTMEVVKDGLPEPVKPLQSVLT